MTPKAFTNKIRWALLALVTLIVIVIRTVQYGFFHGMDWTLYLIFLISVWFMWHYRNE